MGLKKGNLLKGFTPKVSRSTCLPQGEMLEVSDHEGVVTCFWDMLDESLQIQVSYNMFQHFKIIVEQSSSLQNDAFICHSIVETRRYNVG